MIRTLGLAFLAALALTPLAAHDCCGHYYASDHCWRDCDHPGPNCWRQSYSSAGFEALAGTIAEINPLSESTSVEVWLKSGKDTALVRLAPEPFLKQNGFSLKPGDSLTVKGYRANRGSELFVASELECAGKSLVLRGDRGRPAW